MPQWGTSRDMVKSQLIAKVEGRESFLRPILLGVLEIFLTTDLFLSLLVTWLECCVMMTPHDAADDVDDDVLVRPVVAFADYSS